MENKDSENLRLLGIFHFVVAGMAAMVALFPLIHLAVGIGMVVIASVDPQAAFPIQLVGWIFIILASLIILCGLTFAACLAMAGRFLQLRKHYTYCLVMAGVACMFLPFGTVLGVFTIILLTREEIRVSFSPAPRGGLSADMPTGT